MAATGAAGGFLHLRAPRVPSRKPSAAPRLRGGGASCARARDQQPLRRPRAPPPLAVAAAEEAYAGAEAELLDALAGVQGRGRGEVESAVQSLEELGGLPDPTNSSLIEGSWQLIFTTRPGSASPIQRTFVGVDSFKIFQEVYLRTDDPRVVNVVRFSESIGELKVEAEATIEDGKRILFRFDQAAFNFKFLPFKVPYPVPFKLLGDEAKGWLDTTYLSRTGNIRISRGNKGTTFVLQKSADQRQMLLSAISAGTGVDEAIDDLTSSRQGIEADLNTLVGEWQLLWSSKTEDESWSSVASAGLKGVQIIKEDGKLKNLVRLFPGVSLNASGNICKNEDGNNLNLSINEGAIQAGGLQFPLDARGEFFMEILYIDNKIRISNINQHKLVHVRIANRT
uniref:Plastid lipid-associated protein/fibrillin conserved domain-containing protein n=1 Tax=Oryza punctata TaxID=4537 RepID=A0A0E0LKE7_ORYPU